MKLVQKKGPCRAAVLLLVMFLGLVAGERRRPVYIIAHMVNSKADLNEAMKDGANAIESDVAFSDDGTATKLYHGIPCDCFRECHEEERVDVFLNYVRRSMNAHWGKYRHQFALLFLDLKVGNVNEERKYAAGVDLAQKLIQNLWRGVPPLRAMNVLLSIPSVSDKDVLQGAIDTISSYNSTLLDKIGFDVSDNDDLDTIRVMYRQLGIDQHRWQGDGITNCLSYLRSSERLESAIDNRDSKRRDYYVEKVYDWTVDMPEEIRRSLRMGVDGIITNRPRRMSKIVQGNEFKGILYLADVTDNPWTRFVGPSSHPRFFPTDTNHLEDEDVDSVFEDAFSFFEHWV